MVEWACALNRIYLAYRNAYKENLLDKDDDDLCFLNEEQVPGASLRGQDVATLTVLELKRWLQCRRASTKGLKRDLVARYHNESPYINNDSYT